MTSKPVLLDIMEKGRFIGQMVYDKRGFPEIVDGNIVEAYNLKEIEKYVLEERPSLRGRDIKIAFSNQKTLR